MIIVRSIDGMAQLAHGWKKAGLRIALVPTMGALHQGHASLVRAAVRSVKKSGGKVVVSIFVNPLQFGPKEDFGRYPRALRADARMVSKEKVDALFYPSARAIFPEGFSTKVSVPELSKGLCGPFRPGHFEGVATVVAKLFSIIRPDVAFFGQKDYQQCKIIERMTEDLNVGVQTRMLPTVREADGLAMSSRNRYLSAGERKQAAGIYRVLEGARQAVREGHRQASGLRTRAMRGLRHRGIRSIDYVQIVDGDTLRPLKDVRPGALMAVAVRIGDTRLIDNVVLES